MRDCSTCELKEQCAECSWELTCEEIWEKYEDVVLSSCFENGSNNPQGV